MSEKEVLLSTAEWLNSLEKDYNITSDELCEVMGITPNLLSKYKNAEKPMNMDEFLSLYLYLKKSKNMDVESVVDKIFSV